MHLSFTLNLDSRIIPAWLGVMIHHISIDYLGRCVINVYVEQLIQYMVRNDSQQYRVKHLWSGTTLPRMAVLMLLYKKIPLSRYWKGVLEEQLTLTQYIDNYFI